MRFGQGIIIWGWWLAIMLGLLGVGAAQAVTVATAPPSPADLCEHAVYRVAAETGVPADILGALTLTETGRRHQGRVRPWAWSVNAAGKGSWFDSSARALDYVRDRLARGRRNVDIGCFQLNYRWHGQEFGSVQEMFDPLENARYAARFLRQLYAETGDWRAAAGAFHSRRPEHARRYLVRFDQLRTALKQRGGGAMAHAPETYNSFADAAEDVVDVPGHMMPSPGQRQQPRRPRVMLLGAPLGSSRNGRPGSLAVMASGRGSLLGNHTSGALLVAQAGPLFFTDDSVRDKDQSGP